MVGPSNELAFTAAYRLIEDGPDPAEINPLFIHGGCGLGKTHLLQGICRRMLQTRPQAKVLYTTGEQFTNDFLSAMRVNKVEGFRRRIRRLDLLAVDDVHFLANKQATQQEFLHSFDAIELGGARVVLASDCHPKLIKQFSDALVSRCVRGMVVHVQPPDRQTRVKIISALAQRRGMELMDNAVDELAQRCAGSVRDIEGTLTKLYALARLCDPVAENRRSSVHRSGRPRVGHALIGRLLDCEAQHRPHRVIRFDEIVSAVADQIGVARSMLLGSSRHRHVVLARNLVVHLARQLTSTELPRDRRGDGTKRPTQPWSPPRKESPHRSVTAPAWLCLECPRTCRCQRT